MTNRARSIADEESPRYDGHHIGRPRHRTMIEDATVERVARECGMAALGLYTYLERLVGADGAWRTTIPALAAAFQCSPRHVRDACKALEDAGALQRTTITGRNGIATGVDLVLPCHVRTNYPEPTPEPTPEPSRARVLKNVVNVDTRRENAPYSPPQKKPKYADDFEAFWRAYPSGHGVKKLAAQEWAKLDAAQRAEAVAALPEWRDSDKWRRGFVRDGERWLKNREWETPPASYQQPSANGHDDPAKEGQRRLLRMGIV